jgi:hypothetical protein
VDVARASDVTYRAMPTNLSLRRARAITRPN